MIRTVIKNLKTIESNLERIYTDTDTSWIKDLLETTIQDVSKVIDDVQERHNVLFDCLDMALEELLEWNKESEAVQEIKSVIKYWTED